MALLSGNCKALQGPIEGESVLFFREQADISYRRNGRAGWLASRQAGLDRSNVNTRKPSYPMRTPLTSIAIDYWTYRRTSGAKNSACELHIASHEVHSSSEPWLTVL